MPTETQIETDKPAETSSQIPINTKAQPIPDSGYGHPTYRNEMPDPNSPDSPDIIIIITDEGVPLAYRKIQDPNDPNNMIYVEDDTIPLAGPKAGSWALINLILAILSVLAAIFALLRYAAKKRKKDEESRNTGLKEQDDREEEERKRYELRIAGMLALAAAASVLIFFFTEDMRLPMQYVDRWTIVMAILALLPLPGIMARRKKDDEEYKERKGRTA